MNLTKEQLRDFLLLLEDIERQYLDSDIVEIETRSPQKKLSWWQISLLCNEITTPAIIRVSKSDLRSYIMFLYDAESKHHREKSNYVERLYTWQRQSTPQKRGSDSDLYIAQVQYRVERMQAIDKAIIRNKQQGKIQARRESSRHWWFSSEVQFMETVVHDWRAPDTDIPVVTAALEPQDINSHLIRHLSYINFQRNPLEPKQTNADNLTFTSNQNFWSVVLDSQRSIFFEQVQLLGFQLSDWFPRSPGLYHTDEAEECRASSANFLMRIGKNEFYKPSGKWALLRGGIGSVRFKPIQVLTLSHEDFWLCTATSDGLVHTGIPLLVPESLMAKLNPHAVYNLTGKVKFLPSCLEPYFSHLTKVPQIYLLTSNITPIDEVKESVYITPTLFFTSKWDAAKYQGLGGFSTFAICQADSTKALDKAAESLIKYVELYKGEVVTNFDEQRPLFENVPFSLQNVMNGQLVSKKLRDLKIEKAEIICDTIVQVHTEYITTMSKNTIEIKDNAHIMGDVIAGHAISIQKGGNSSSVLEIERILSEMKMLVFAQANLSPETKRDYELEIDSLKNEIAKSKPSAFRVREILSILGDVEGILGLASRFSPYLALLYPLIEKIVGQ